ncbi:MAG TPA: hypothetical protein VJ722_09650 [Rhodanobacteraceae bacterium]|nr:hypothetical protein [Rhodanobacteraceae bacterium]
MAKVGPVFPWDRLQPLADYEVVDADLEHACADALGVWRSTIGWPGRQEEVFRRYYLEHPGAEPELKFLRHRPAGKVVGTLGVSPRRVSWHGCEIRAGMLSHFCVLPEHRRMRPPMFLFKATIDACRGRYDALYAIPGTLESAPHAMALGRIAAAGVTTAFKIRRVKVLRSARYGARFLPRPLAGAAGVIIDAGLRVRNGLRAGGGRVEAGWVHSATAEMAALWQATPWDGRWCAARDFAMLRWRFDSLPSFQRRYLLVREVGASESDGLLAWFACAENYYDRESLVVQDFWAKDGPERIARAAIRALCRAARQAGYAAVEMRLAAPDDVANAWTREGFIERNRSPVPIFWLNPDVEGGTAGPLHITEFDNDG